MKKLVFVASVFVGLFLFTATASADSPLTSTPFYYAYEDILIVNEAAEAGVVNEGIADYLSDEKKSLDVKAAVINALSWDFNGKANADIYCSLIYHSSLDDLDINSLSGDQQFCIGYLMAMDDYFHTDQPLEYLKLAENNIPDSFTVSIIRALVESMDLEDVNWEKHIWPILQNSSLKRDMRQKAVNIILDYMALYSEEQELIVSQNNLMIEKEGSQTVYLYGTLVWDDKIQYEIVKDSSLADSKIGIDKYGIYYLMLTGIENGSSSLEVKNSEGKSVIINFDVISKAEGIVSDIPDTGTASMGLILGFWAAATAFTALVLRTKKYRTD